MALIREPSGKRPSTIGELSSIRATKRGDHALDYPHQVGVVVKPEIGLVNPAFSLNVDKVGAVHHNLGDGVILGVGVPRGQIR